MNYLLRAIRLALRLRFTVLGVIFTSLMVALLWGANIGAVYPFVEVVFQNKSMHEWADDSIQKSQRACGEIQVEIDGLRQQLPSAATAADRRRLENQIAFQENRLAAERKAVARTTWLRPMIQRYLPASAFQTLLLIVAFLFIGTLLKDVFLVSNILLVSRISELTTFELRHQMFHHILDRELSAFGKERSTDLMSRITGDISSIGSTVAYLFGKATREPLKMFACIIGAVMISWRLMAFCLLICPVAFYLMYRLSGSIKRANRRLMEETSRLFGRLAQTFTAIQVVKAFTMEQFERSRFRQTAMQVYQKSMRITFYDSLTRLNNEIFGVGVICVAIMAGGYLVLNQETHLFGIKMTDRPLSFGSLLLFYAFLVGVSDPARKLADVIATVQRGVAGAERVYPLLDQKSQIVDPVSPRSLDNPCCDLVFDRVSFHYMQAQPVLEDINLRIRFDETLAIVGPNGCGKTTLVNLIPRFYDPIEGEVRLGEINLRDLRKRDLRQQIGIVTQQTMLFDDTVMNNIRYGTLEATDEQVVEAAKKAHAHQFIVDKLEDGYETDVGEYGGRLSGGQRQRIALARAILHEPSILILDETTSQIDPESEQLIHKTLEQFIRGRTTIMITHRMSSLDLADRILVMESGRVADIGTHNELISRCDFYRRFYQSSMKESA